MGRNANPRGAHRPWIIYERSPAIIHTRFNKFALEWRVHETLNAHMPTAYLALYIKLKKWKFSICLMHSIFLIELNLIKLI